MSAVDLDQLERAIAQCNVGSELRDLAAKLYTAGWHDRGGTEAGNRRAALASTFILDVVNNAGTPFRVVAYTPGAIGPYPAAVDPARALVEFYDRHHPHTEHGQFTGGRYLASSLLTEPPTGGLNLYGGVSAWYLDAATYAQVDTWLRSLPLDGAE